MEIQDLETTLLEKEELFILFENGNMIKSNLELKFEQEWLKISQDCSFKIIYADNKRSNTTVFILIEENVKAKIEEIYAQVADENEYTLHLQLEKNAYLDFFSMKYSKKIESIKTNINTHLKENAYINSKNIVCLSKNSQGKVQVELASKYARAEIQNIFINIAGEKQQYDMFMHHRIGETDSKLKNYAIASNQSTLTINNHGIIQKGAAATDLYQNTKGILLDMYSAISANPILMIDEFDVIAGHGASIGAIDDEELYYLMSRGLSKVEAEKLIISGFTLQFTNELKEGKFKEYVHQMIGEALI